MSSVPSLSLSSLLGNLSFSLMPHIHLTTTFSFLTGQVSLLCNMLLCTQLLCNLPLIINDTSLLVSSGTNCLNLFQPILILASTAASASPSTLNMSPRKVVERIFEHRIRQQIVIDDMQFGFLKGKGTTDVVKRVCVCYYCYYVPSVLWRCWLGGRKGIWPVKNLSGGVLAWLSLERDADLHMAQLMPLPLTVSCFSKIQISFTFLVPSHMGGPGKRAVKRMCVCVYVLLSLHATLVHSCVDCNGCAQAWFCDDLLVRTVDTCVYIWRINPRLFESNKARVWN